MEVMMRTQTELQTKLREIDHKGYKAYKVLEGEYDFGAYRLCIDHVQGDPFASPSKVSLILPGRVAGFDRELYASEHRRIAFQDYLLRRVAAKIKEYSDATIEALELSAEVVDISRNSDGTNAEEITSKLTELTTKMTSLQEKASQLESV